MNRREFTTLAAASAANVIAAPMVAAQERPAALRIGFQKSSTLFGILKLQGTLEKELAPLGVKVTWSEFPNGLPLLEALNVGALDFSADVADTVPLFAQAAGAKLTYFARETPSPTAQAILVAPNSPITTVADLKGKKVAVTKAAGSHYLLIAALAKAGLSSKDIVPAYLTASDGRAAFERGAVDAWVTWDPFLAAVETQSAARKLINGEGLASYQRYYLASTTYARQRPDVLRTIFPQLQATGTWVKKNPAEAAKLLAPFWGLSEEIVQRANARRSYDVRTVTQSEFIEQQKIADTFLAEGLLPHRVDAKEAGLWSSV